jgi:hypothetical protein
MSVAGFPTTRWRTSKMPRSTVRDDDLVRRPKKDPICPPEAAKCLGRYQPTLRIDDGLNQSIQQSSQRVPMQGKIVCRPHAGRKTLLGKLICAEIRNGHVRRRDLPGVAAFRIRPARSNAPLAFVIMSISPPSVSSIPCRNNRVVSPSKRLRSPSSIVHLNPG